MTPPLDSANTDTASTTTTAPEVIDPAAAAILRGVARHGLTTVAGYLVAHGYLAGSDTQQFIGAGLVFAGLAWSVLDKLARAELQRLAELAAAQKARGTVSPSSPPSLSKPPGSLTPATTPANTTNATAPK